MATPSVGCGLETWENVHLVCVCRYGEGGGGGGGAGQGRAGGNTLRCHRETILRCYSQWNVKTTTTHITRSFSCVSWSVGQSVSRSCDAAASLHAHKHFRDRGLWRRERASLVAATLDAYVCPLCK